jgi:hypothetical protein
MDAMLLALLTAVLAQAPRAPVFVDHGELFAKAGKAQGLNVGDRVTLLGDEGRKIASAMIIESWPDRARLVPDEDGVKPQGVALPRAQVAPRAAATDLVTSRTAKRRAEAAVVDDRDTMPDGTRPRLGEFLTAKCGGRDVAVTARWTLTGRFITLSVDGARVAAGELGEGEPTLAGRGAVLRVAQGDFSLVVSGKPCTLVNH